MRPFFEVATDFCTHLQHIGNRVVKDDRLPCLLAELLQAAYGLPNDFLTYETAPPYGGHIDQKFYNCISRYGVDYRSVISPWGDEAKLVSRVFYRDLAKIYRDVAEGCYLHSHVSPAVAENYWNQSFRKRWGHIAASVLQALTAQRPQHDLEFVSTADPGLIDLRSERDYTELYVASQPLALTWATEVGSTIDRLVRFASPDGEAKLTEFRCVMQGSEEDKAIVRMVVPLLAAGRYRLLQSAIDQVDACLPSTSTSVAKSAGFYGGDWSAITTFREDLLDLATVEKYRAAIEAGQRPRLIGICAYMHDMERPDTAFIIDGHHKLRAYQLLKIHAPMLLIARLNSPPPRQPYPPEFHSVRGRAWRSNYWVPWR